MSGRPRKPTGLKLVEGNAGKRGVNAGEPEPMLLNDLAPSKRMEPRSKAVWLEIAPMLRSMQVLTIADVMALEMLCDSIADYRYSRQQRGDDFVVTSAKGSEMISQWLVAQQMSARRADTMMSSFGMTPAARSKLMINPQGDLFAPAADTGPARFFKPA